MGFVTTRVERGVARVTLERPPLNIVDLGTARELAAALEEVRGGEPLAAVVIQSRGRAFCAGVDVRDHLPDRGADMLLAFHRVCRLLLDLEAPVIAAVRGPALGGGCELTLACDIVIAAAEASFSQPEILLGVFPPLACVALPHRVPAHLASEMVLTGRTLTADEALRGGLVNRVVPGAELEAAVEVVLEKLRSLSVSSLRVAKRALRIAQRFETRDLEAAERLYIDQLMNTPDAIEGLEAFLGKRAPVWRNPGYPAGA